MKLKEKLMSVTLASGLALGAAASWAEELTVATFVPPQHHINSFFFDWFGKEIAERSDGSMTMQLFPAGQLGAGPVQQYKRVVEGVADITFGLQTYTPALFPKSILAVPPGKHTTSLESTAAILEVYDEYLADEYEDVHLIGIFTVAGDAWAATKDISTLEGINGAKIVPFASMTSPIFEAWGAVPVQMPVTEMYTGLSTGTIDGTSISASQLTPPWNFGEVSTHYVDNIPVSFAIFFVAMNKERYMGLSDEHRAIIDDLSGEVASMMGAQSFHNDAVRGMKANDSDAPQVANVSFVSISEEERAKMDALTAEALQGIFADYASRGIDNAEDIYNALNK